MVEHQIRGRGITSDAVLSAMRTVPRHLFLPDDLQSEAYADRAVPLGRHRSVSQPYIVALMTELASPRASDRVLEVGTGSGYQAAVLAELAEDVYTIELDPVLAARAEQNLRQLRYRGVHTRCGDGREGWLEAAPFGAILVTACTDTPPPILVDQLAMGGRLVVPTGTRDRAQVLSVFTRGAGSRLARRETIPVRFVPLE
jgi:protein-L-isoaspartate(D-aspartate) O-methyltransferase